jgi:predicted ArsR family transcriptional regulator
VLRLLAEGRTNREIARTLHVSDDTVKFHLKNLFERLGAENRTEGGAGQPPRPPAVRPLSRAAAAA